MSRMDVVGLDVGGGSASAPQIEPSKQPKFLHIRNISEIKPVAKLTKVPVYTHKTWLHSLFSVVVSNPRSQA